MRDTLLNNWNFIRVLRLLLGIGAFIQGIFLLEWFLAFAGLLIAGMAAFNFGCCGTNGCATSANRKGIEKKEIVYEEVGS